MHLAKPEGAKERQELGRAVRERSLGGDTTHRPEGRGQNELQLCRQPFLSQRAKLTASNESSYVLSHVKQILAKINRKLSLSISRTQDLSEYLSQLTNMQKLMLLHSGRRLTSDAVGNVCP